MKKLFTIFSIFCCACGFISCDPIHIDECHPHYIETEFCECCGRYVNYTYRCNDEFCPCYGHFYCFNCKAHHHHETPYYFHGYYTRSAVNDSIN